MRDVKTALHADKGYRGTGCRCAEPERETTSNRNTNQGDYPGYQQPQGYGQPQQQQLDPQYGGYGDRGHSPSGYPGQGANSSYYGAGGPGAGAPQYGAQGAYPQGPDGSGGPDGPEGEKGLAATVVGGAGGAFAGHKYAGGALGTLGGAVVGALGANAVEHGVKKSVPPLDISFA